MSDRPFRPTRTVSDYPPSHHLPAPSFRTYAVLLAVGVAVAAVVTFPLLSLVTAMTAVVAIVVARTLATRASWSSLRVGVPGMPVEVTVARTSRD
ncbi:hypothetical protein ACFQJC_09360 [Haloferax namakaokahaiae]|uniref:DUF58 domain-containing protein n=1 Tax=Haloferax namakaokahaiae TaxID=1748331 RepID=A0ABD5ZEK0_9EURY